jgi:hypothetical protein
MAIVIAGMVAYFDQNRQVASGRKTASSGGTALGATSLASAQLRVSSGGVAKARLKWEPNGR